MRVHLLVALAVGIAGAGAAHAQMDLPTYVLGSVESGGVAVWTDHTSYERGSTITVYGYGTSGPITILVLSPNGNLADVHQLDAAGPFSLEMDTGGPYWKTDGWYRLTARAAPDSEPFSLVVGVEAGCLPGTIPVDAGEQGVHCMVAEGATAAVLDAPRRTLYLHVYEEDTTLHIPRYLLDSRAGGADAAFAVMRDGQPIPYIQIAVDENSRTIVIKEEGSVSISGTHAISEFSAVILAAAAAVLAAIFLSGRGARMGVAVAGANKP